MISRQTALVLFAAIATVAFLGLMYFATEAAKYGERQDTERLKACIAGGGMVVGDTHDLCRLD